MSNNLPIERHQLSANEKNITQMLPPAVLEFVVPRQEKPFSQYSRVMQKTICLGIITRAFTDGSPNGMPTPEILQFQTESLLTEVENKFSTMTVSEIQTAFYLGVRGESGPYFGMCPKSYNQFLKWYFNLPERSAAWNKYLDLLENVKTSNVPVYFTKDKLKELAIEAFNDYKSAGKLPFVSHAIYDTIKELTGRKTLIDPKAWENVKEQAKKAITPQVKRGKTENIEKLLTFENRTYEFACKKIMLKMYFDDLITDNLTPQFTQ